MTPRTPDNPSTLRRVLEQRRQLVMQLFHDEGEFDFRHRRTVEPSRAEPRFREIARRCFSDSRKLKRKYLMRKQVFSD